MTTPAPTSYDEVAYPGQPQPQAHPDLLATIATLHGLGPAPGRCRVLELGCGDGANLVPLADALPGSRFLGIDLAPTPIERGRALLAELGLSNVELRCGDVMDLPADLGTFDYVIAHGLYSWVPAPVRDRILAIARDHLAPHGVAYVSHPALAAASAARPEPALDGETMTFRTPTGAAIAFDLPAAKAVLLHLGECHPRAVPFAELLAATSARLGTKADAATLAAVLLESFAVGVVELFTEPPRFAVRAGERPEVSAVARLQLRAGQKMLTNLRHAPVAADHPLTRQLLLLMDGTRDRAALLDGLTAWAVAHPPAGQEPLPPEQVRQRLAGLIEPGLAQATALALIKEESV